ncbi:nicotinamide mononucleotide transporter family protein [Nakamurella lactea]|uniref:nicotinamide mononucleotide transporter family protein n=1 Tax=Nakamurella lactea TaxID=459515 RepID=UPI00068887EC|nr:nicotinamide mononucleotide transporter family protein [Nakamurella lactea]
MSVDRSVESVQVFSWLNETVTIVGLPVRWSDLFGNVFAVATVVLAMQRRVIAWPVQILGSVLLLSATLAAHLPGNALRQVVIIVGAVWGWTRWRHDRASEGTLTVSWASPRQRIVIGTAMVVGTAGVAGMLKLTNGSFFPEAPWHLVIADAWIFVGSVIAMYAQGRRVVEFWLVWIAVDLVGVPLAISSGLYFSGIVYGLFFVMVILGLRDWASRSQQTISSPVEGARRIVPLESEPAAPPADLAVVKADTAG